MLLHALCQWNTVVSFVFFSAFRLHVHTLHTLHNHRLSLHTLHNQHMLLHAMFHEHYAYKLDVRAHLEHIIHSCGRNWDERNYNIAVDLPNLCTSVIFPNVWYCPTIIPYKTRFNIAYILQVLVCLYGSLKLHLSISYIDDMGWRHALEHRAEDVANEAGTPHTA